MKKLKNEKEMTRTGTFSEHSTLKLFTRNFPLRLIDAKISTIHFATAYKKERKNVKDVKKRKEREKHVNDHIRVE